LEPPETRQAFLSRVCVSDEIRAEVERLLTEYDQAGDFLSQPVMPHGNFIESNVRRITENPLANSLAIQVADGLKLVDDHQTVGPYRLLQQIGEGGMGKVWLAEQTYPIRRRVALKLIRAGMDTREVVARFESERQALALMDHPAIAKVFDAGSTTSGLPYFVMEYVPGMPITEWCDKYKLTVRERLELFIQMSMCA
jgi:eukaryotic-like serine/threonine-protein kinase